MTDEHTRQQLAEKLWRREGGACVSFLVSTLAAGFTGNGSSDMENLCEQAMELASPVPDYEQAATQDGWTGPHFDKFGALYYENKTESEQNTTWCAGSWQELCEAFDLEPHEREVFEHWIVSDWLADRLTAKGEKCDKDFAGLTVWARTTTGQSIACDGVIQEIACDLWPSAADRKRVLA